MRHSVIRQRGVYKVIGCPETGFQKGLLQVCKREDRIIPQLLGSSQVAAGICPEFTGSFARRCPCISGPLNIHPELYDLSLLRQQIAQVRPRSQQGFMGDFDGLIPFRIHQGAIKYQ